MRTTFGAVFLALAAGVPAMAQQNPFKLPKLNLKGQVEYALGGDQKGTATSAFDGDRIMSRTTSTTKMMGKETQVSHWSLITPDSMYQADLIKKKGHQSANLMPLMAKAYDGLDGAGKGRLHSNLKEMTTMVSQAFGTSSFQSLGEKKGELTIAGEVCDDRQFGSFEICSMKRGPRVSLKTTGDLLCFRVEETATSVSLSSPASSVFDKPADVVFTSNQQNADSMAQGFVGYLASKELADSLAAGKARMEEAKAKAQADGKPTEMTAEQKEQAKAACEMIKNFDLGKVFADIGKAMVQSMKNAAADGAKQSATNKLKGLIRRPKLP